MSKHVSLIVTDDLDGSENAHTVSFGLDDVSYEIDLSDENRAKLEQALAPFINAARRVPRGSRRYQAGPPSGSAADRAALRAWGKAASLKVSERGRISGVVVREYEASRSRPEEFEVRFLEAETFASAPTQAGFGLGNDQPDD